MTLQFCLLFYTQILLRSTTFYFCCYFTLFATDSLCNSYLPYYDLYNTLCDDNYKNITFYIILQLKVLLFASEAFCTLLTVEVTCNCLSENKSRKENLINVTRMYRYYCIICYVDG